MSAEFVRLTTLVETRKLELAKANNVLDTVKGQWYFTTQRKKNEAAASEKVTMAEERLRRAEETLAEFLQAQSSMAGQAQSSMAGQAQSSMAGSSFREDPAGGQKCPGAEGCSSLVAAGLNVFSQLQDALGPIIRDLGDKEKLKFMISGGIFKEKPARTIYTGILVPCTNFPEVTKAIFSCIDSVNRPFYFCANNYLKPIWRWGKYKKGEDESYRWYNNQTREFIFNNDELPKMIITRDALSNPNHLPTRIFEWSPVYNKWQWKDFQGYDGRNKPIYTTFNSLPGVSYSTPYRYDQITRDYCPIDDPYDLDHLGQPFTYRPPPGTIFELASYFPQQGGKRKTKSRKYTNRKHKKSRRNRR